MKFRIIQVDIWKARKLGFSHMPQRLNNMILKSQDEFYDTQFRPILNMIMK